VTRNEEVAWAAGLFEGEGSIYAHRMRSRGSRSNDRIALLAVQVKMGDEDVVLRFCDAVGVGSVTGPFKGKAAHHRLMWRWRVVSDEAEKTLALLEPFLGTRRRAQLRDVRSAITPPVGRGFRHVLSGEEPATCQRCGKPLVGKQTAMVRRYCSDNCRKRHFEERRRRVI
jgi:hypothetical protein